MVGGAVRDVLLGINTHDWDFTTSATPTEIQKLFPGSFYDNAFGTVGIAGSHLAALTEDPIVSERLWKVHGWPTAGYEITTFRTESGYTNRRHPDKVTWGKTIEEDLARRDFTVNAIALLCQNSQLRQGFDGQANVITESEFNETEIQLIDPYEGQRDLKAKVIRTVGTADTRFGEDALRMMRAIRLGAQLGFAIDPVTLGAIQKNAALIKQISWERISAEMMKILGSPFPAEGITLLYNASLLEHIVPEALLMRGVRQAGRHKLDVWNHALESLRECPSSDGLVRLAAWLHDVGKPQSYREQGPRGVTFYGHEVVGARIVETIAKRWRLSAKQIAKLVTLVRWHMFAYDPSMTDAAIRRFIVHVGVENINDMMLLRVGDRKGGGSKATSWRLRELQQRIGKQLSQPMTLRDLKVDGADVMRELAIKPSKKVGEVMNALFEEVMEDTSKNEREFLLKRIKELA